MINKLFFEIIGIYRVVGVGLLLKWLFFLVIKFPEIIKEKSFFIQVNTGKEITKSGVFPEDTKNFLNLCKTHGLNKVEGLMCIPPINQSPTKHFQTIIDLTKECGLERPSIGMSSDYHQALEFEPKYIRLGTILFGKRA